MCTRDLCPSRHVYVFTTCIAFVICLMRNSKQIQLTEKLTFHVKREFITVETKKETDMDVF